MTARVTSAIPRALENLYQLCATSPDLMASGTVTVVYGKPTNPVAEVVAITGNVEAIEQTPNNQGNFTRKEKFAADVRVNVLRTGDDTRAAIERAFELLGIIELRILRLNPTLQLRTAEQGPVVLSHITPTSIVTNTHPDGIECEITCLVLCEARI